MTDKHLRPTNYSNDVIMITLSCDQ